MRIDFSSSRKYKTGITAEKIIVLIRTRETDGEPEIPRSSAVSAKQGYMAAKMGKMAKGETGRGITTPVQLITGHHPDYKKQIYKCMNK